MTWTGRIAEHSESTKQAPSSVSEESGLRRHRIPIGGRKVDGPELRRRLLKFECNAKLCAWQILHPNDPAALFQFCLHVGEDHGLTREDFHLQLEQSAMRVHRDG